jgi:hypothetical protein
MIPPRLTLQDGESDKLMKVGKHVSFRMKRYAAIDRRLGTHNKRRSGIGSLMRQQNDPDDPLA